MEQQEGISDKLVNYYKHYGFSALLMVALQTGSDDSIAPLLYTHFIAMLDHAYKGRRIVEPEGQYFEYKWVQIHIEGEKKPRIISIEEYKKGGKDNGSTNVQKAS